MSADPNPVASEGLTETQLDPQTVIQGARALLKGPENHNRMAIDNDDLQSLTLTTAQVICINGPPGIDQNGLFRALIEGLQQYTPLSAEDLANREIGNNSSPYVAMLQTPDLDHTVPDRLIVEVVSKVIDYQLSQGQRWILLKDFPRNLNTAAIFEEDCCRIRAFVQVQGNKPPRIPRPSWNASLHALRPVFEKLAADGRAFKIDKDKSPQQLRIDIDHLIEHLKSPAFRAKVLTAKDVLKPEPPSGWASLDSAGMARAHVDLVRRRVLPNNPLANARAPGETRRLFEDSTARGVQQFITDTSGSNQRLGPGNSLGNAVVLSLASTQEPSSALRVRHSSLHERSPASTYGETTAGDSVPAAAQVVEGLLLPGFYPGAIVSSTDETLLTSRSLLLRAPTGRPQQATLG
ncbi:MAG: hypothetical protein Q9168_005968 [Polycauliona sp. 1 TL-2023]